MKKFFTLLTIFTLLFTACEDPPVDDEQDQNQEETLPSLTIRNQSSYILTNVKFSGITFSASDNDLPVSSQSTKKLTKNDLNKAGYITFTRKDIGINLRTEAISISNEDYTFNFLDTTIVEEVGNSANKRSLAQISFQSTVTVERGGLTVAKGEILPLGEAVVNIPVQFNFTLKNTGVGKLLFAGTQPVKITGEGSEVFSVVQPTSSEIAPNASLPFRINFNPNEIKNYSALVTISSNDQSGDFTFTITAAGVPPKPIAEITYNNNDILQEGTIDIGEMIFTLSKNIIVIIKNTGTLPLEIETNNMTITGSEASSFTKTTSPGGTISVNSQSSFIIECNPVKLGENNAALLIPTNDNSRNPVIIYLKVTANQGHSVLELSQGSTVISNNSVTPFDFGQVDLGSNKQLVFTIKNTTGNIPLELNGNPMIVSSNANFTIFSQPLSNAVSPGSSTTFVIQYEPTSEIVDTGSITISNNSDSMIFTMNVKGTGYVKKPQITMKQNTTTINQYGEFNFGTVAIGDPKDISFTIGNSGDANLTFVTVNNNRINLGENDDGFFSVIQQPSSSTVVTPGNTTTFTIRFAPTTAGNGYMATVLIETNSRTNDDFSFIVKANSYEKKPQITIKQNNSNIAQNGEYDFGTMSLASGDSIDVTFTIGNSGEANLIIDTVNNNRINLADNAAGHFTVISQPASATVVSPGSSTTFTIRFKPKSIGTNFYAVVQIKTNSQINSDFSFRLKGSCVPYVIGDAGPGGGTICYISGNQYRECSAILGSYTWSNAVTAAGNHRGGNFTNWHLPNMDEMTFVDDVALTSGTYWTSSNYPYENNSAYCYEFYPGSYYPRVFSPASKTNLFYVRAIRDFSL